MVLDAAQGLTWEEAENAMALALVRQKCFDPKTITELKAQMVKKSAALEFSQFKETFETLGGLENLKDWTLDRFEKRRPGLPFRGILLLGVPGTGKSHFAKALGNQVGWPCLSLNLGKVFGSLVGESEAKMRDALKVVDAMAPCILFLDEIEKGLAGVGGSSTDGGTTQRVGGTFLNLAERSHLRGVRHRHLQRLLASSPRNTPGWAGGTPSFLWITRGPRERVDILNIYGRQFMGSKLDFPNAGPGRLQRCGNPAGGHRGRLQRRGSGGGSPVRHPHFPVPERPDGPSQGMGQGPDHPGQQAGPGRGQGQEEGAVMMAVEISEETRQIIEVPVPISLPKWAWLIITARAKALHEGDIDACVQELLNVGIQSEIKIMGTVGPEGGN